MLPIPSVRLLGRFELSLNDDVVQLDSARAEALLAYLLLHRGSTISRQRLAAAFWPDSTEAQARTNLRHVLHTLRARLPTVEEYVEITARTLRWRPDAPLWLDVDGFEETRDLELYGGDLLEEADDDWLEADRTRLRRTYLEALDTQAERAEADGDHTAAAAATERLLREDPLREDAHRRLIRLYDSAGDKARAVAAYHECASILERELGIPPSPPTRAAYEAVMASERTTTEAPIAPFVARAAEREQLVATWKQAEAGSARLVVVGGDAGVGKTRLAEEFRAWCARRGAVVAAASCYAAEGPLAYGAVVGWLRSPPVRERIARTDSHRRTELARILPKLLTDDPSLERPAELPQAEQRQRLFDAVASVLAPTAPTLLSLDDLQYADGETCALVHYLLRANPAARLLILATARREELTAGHRELVASLQARGDLVELELASLDRAETALLASRIAGTDFADDELFEETEGNPLFVVEAVRAGWRPGSPPSPRVQAVIEARLDQLPNEVRDLIEVAATIGREFAPDVLAEAADLDQDALVGGLDELWRRRLVRESGNRYDFAHHRIREVAAARVTPARRRMLHGRIANALERSGAPSASIATHYEQAGASDQAVAFLRKAAVESLSLHAYEQAVEQLDRALTQTLDAQTELTIRTALLAPLAVLDGFASPRIQAQQERVTELSETPSPALLRSIALSALSASDFDTAVSAGKRLAETGDEVDVVEASYVLGIAAFWRADFATAKTAFERVVELYRPEQYRAHLIRYGQDPKVVCLARLGNTLSFLGEPDAAREAREEALAWADELGHPLTRQLGLVFGALLALDQGDLPTLRALVASFPEGYEQAPVRLAVEAYRGYLAVIDGAVDDGLAAVRSAAEEAAGHESAPGLAAVLARIRLASAEAAGRGVGEAADRLLALGGAACVFEPAAFRARQG
ncbi:ATP-binding protein [Tenggerimyces flavus]|uniref:ATP-binding protein n=1 Tax=Tenggerimyces flavus TaxID=1708749 RepID=A0ABV7YC39_9ACTN|nr:AAA family ATPase [Tenggerimyces flavus]MBM7787164.1 DNA-binding SARP family transcriptional activator [Tenggerimyces flavus]